MIGNANTSRRCIQCDDTGPILHDIRPTDFTHEQFHGSSPKEEVSPSRTSFMSDYHERLASFEKWPRHVKTSPEEFADAGFFFLGSADRVRCFRCNGSFHNWKESDRPWESHAKFFPNCEYVLQEKGIRFVRAIANKHPNLNGLRPVSPGLAKSQEFLSPSSSPKEESERNSFLQFRNSFLTSAANFNPEAPHNSLQVENSGAMNQVSTAEQKLDENSNVVQARLKVLKEEETCKVCLDSRTDCLFLPCRHICCCVKCACALRNCPICREKLTKIIKVYRT